MSKRCFSWGMFSSAPPVVLVMLVALLIGIAPSLSLAADTNVRIPEVSNAYLQNNVYVDVTLDNSASQRNFGGFDLLIAYDANALTFSSATAGDLLLHCGWEYFNYRSGPMGDCGIPCPSGFVRIIAVGDMGGANPHPSCYLQGQSGVIAHLNFTITSDPAFLGHFTPLSFYWLECSHNALCSIFGDTLYADRQVFDSPAHNNITGQTGYGGWQGIYGAPDCPSLYTPGHAPDTSLVFYDGGVQISPYYSVDMRGDINRNGIPNEVSDLEMLCNYLFHGISAFPVGFSGQSLAASDVNNDGRPGSYLDAAYLMRIVYGDAVAYPKQRTNAAVDAYFHQDTTTHSVEVTFAGDLAGAYLVMSGEITPSYAIPAGFKQETFFDGHSTKILILGDPDHRYASGTWFTYQGTGTLLYAETADWNDDYIVSHIDAPAAICGDFNGSGDIDISDAVQGIAYIFSGGTPPLDGHFGDANCDNIYTISDVVYLLQYIFANGPAPCATCK